MAAFTGIAFTGCHARAAAALLRLIDAPDAEIDILDGAIRDCLEQIPAACGVSAGGVPGPDPGPDAPVLAAVDRLAEIPGVSEDLARAIIAETGLDMTRFPDAGHLVSWAGMAPVADQSGPRTRKGKKGHGDSYLRCYLTQAANGAARTGTFLGERHQRLTRRLGRKKAKVAVGRSILIIIWHLLYDPEARFRDLGPGHYLSKNDKDKKIRNHIRQLHALGVDVTLTPRAA